MSANSNTIRKFRALLNKTVANGCTVDEASSALQMAKDIVAKHGLDPARFEWPEEPVPATAPVPPDEPVKPTKPNRQRKAKSDKPKKVARPDKLMELIQRPVGVSLAELMVEFNVLQHTAGLHRRRHPETWGQGGVAGWQLLHWERKVMRPAALWLVGSNGASMDICQRVHSVLTFVQALR